MSVHEMGGDAGSGLGKGSAKSDERASGRSSDNPFEPGVNPRKALPADSDGVKAAGAAVHRLRGH